MLRRRTADTRSNGPKTFASAAHCREQNCGARGGGLGLSGASRARGAVVTQGLYGDRGPFFVGQTRRCDCLNSLASVLPSFSRERLNGQCAAKHGDYGRAAVKSSTRYPHATAPLAQTAIRRFRSATSQLITGAAGLCAEFQASFILQMRYFCENDGRG